MGQKKEKIIIILALIIFLVGSSGSIFFALNSPVGIAKVQSFGTIPLPLVFDSPKGYQFWSNSYTLTFKTNKDNYKIKITDEEFDKLYENVIIFNSIAIPVVMIPIQNPYQWKPVVQKNLCSPGYLRKKLLTLKKNEKLLRVNIFIQSFSNSSQQWEEEVVCL